MIFSYIRSASKRDKKIIFILAFLFYITFEMIFRSYLSMTFAFSLLLAMIIMEDYRNSEVDMLNAGCLGLIGCFLCKDIMSYILNLLIAFAVFSSIMYLSIRSASEGETENKVETFPEKCMLMTEMPYIPCLGAALFGFSWYLEIFNPDVPCYLYPMDYLFLSISESTEYWEFLIAAFAFLVISKLVSMSRLKSDAVYGMGDGDPFVLAVLAALFGARYFFIIFFLSMLAVLLAGGVIILIKGKFYGK